MKHPGPPLAQSLSALEYANQIRTDRKELRERVTAGEVQAIGVLNAPPACVAGVELLTFLMWLPQVGRIQAMKITRAATVPGYTRLSELTEWQLERLTKALTEKLHPAQRGLA